MQPKPCQIIRIKGKNIMNFEEQCVQSLVRIASEAYRFRKVFLKAMSHLDPETAEKYLNQYAWFEKSICNALQSSEIEIVDLQGQLYDPGLPLTALNLDDFSSDNALYVQQMMEPVIMRKGSVIKTGTAILDAKDNMDPFGG